MAEQQNDTDKKNQKRKMRKRTKIIITTVSILVILIAISVGMYMNLRNNMYVETKPEEIESVNYKEVEGITNVLLIGTDGRTLDEPARSDAMIIATLDSNNKVVKTTSIMRDTLVDVPGYHEMKINEAFAYGTAEGGLEGGVKLLFKTIEQNFGLSLNKYAIINFWGFESVIDEIGGIEVNVKDYEIDELNKYIGESTGTKSELITEPGLHTLNGAQALSYSRIRKVGDGSYERTERQRFVLSKVAEKMKKTNPIKYLSIANSLSKYIKTNLDMPECLDLAYTIYKFPDLKIEQLQIPQTELIARDGKYKDKGWVLLVDKKQNAKVMDDFIFKNKIPDPKEFDMGAVADLTARYDSEQANYISTTGIKQEDYNDKNRYEEEIVPDKKPQNTKPEVKPEVKPENKPEVKPEAEQEVKPEVKPEENQDQKPEEKPDSKPTDPDKGDQSTSATVDGNQAQRTR